MAKAVLVLNGIDDNFPALHSTLPQEQLQAVRDYLLGAAQGIRNFESLEQRADAVAAAGTITCASVSDADTVSIAGVTLTAETGTIEADEFDVTGDDDADAAALAAIINAHATLSKRVVATVVDNVVTVTSKVPGDIGNGLALSSSNGTRLAVTAFTGGSNDDLVTYTR